MKCTKCSGTKTKSRTNYPYGRNAKSRTTVTCVACGSMQFETEKKRRNFRRR